MLNAKNLRFGGLTEFSPRYRHRYDLVPSTRLRKVESKSTQSLVNQEEIQPSLSSRLSEDQVHLATMKAFEEVLNEYGDVIDALANC